MSHDAQQALLMMWEEMRWFYFSYIADEDKSMKPDPGASALATGVPEGATLAAVAVAGTAVLDSASARRGDKMLSPAGGCVARPRPLCAFSWHLPMFGVPLRRFCQIVPLGLVRARPRVVRQVLIVK
jgi:hypothetical protein